MQKNLNETMDLLQEWVGGDTKALNKLVSHVYADLHRIAHALMNKERDDHTLSPAALINELYLKLLKRNYTALNDRVHFLSMAILELRRILIDHARKKNASKRAANLKTDLLDYQQAINPEDQLNLINLLALKKALVKLHSMDSAACQIIEFRIFAGFSIAEIATTLEVTERTVYRRCTWAQNWLYKQLQ